MGTTIYENIFNQENQNKGIITEDFSGWSHFFSQFLYEVQDFSRWYCFFLYTK